MLTLQNFDDRLRTLDLGPIIHSVVKSEEGPRWTLSQALIVERWYRKFHKLIHVRPDLNVVPNKIIDIFWHHHILDTEKYHEDCIFLHGKMIHHFPYLGVRSEEDKILLQQCFEHTTNAFLEVFGETPIELELAFRYKGSSAGIGVVCTAGPPDPPNCMPHRTRISLTIRPTAPSS